MLLIKWIIWSSFAAILASSILASTSVALPVPFARFEFQCVLAIISYTDLVALAITVCSTCWNWMRWHRRINLLLFTFLSIYALVTSWTGFIWASINMNTFMFLITFISSRTWVIRASIWWKIALSIFTLSRALHSWAFVNTFSIHTGKTCITVNSNTRIIRNTDIIFTVISGYTLTGFRLFNLDTYAIIAFISIVAFHSWA